MEDILLSWISEYAYCRRRFYLRYVECMNATSADMVEGRYQHRVVDERHIIKRGMHLTVSGIYVSSKKYTMHGICDNVEFDKLQNGTYIPFLNGIYQITPVEFKHGKVRSEYEYEQQLCAQAICLEEMFCTSIRSGVLYYVDSKDRHDVTFTEKLRNDTVNTVKNMKEDISRITSVSGKAQFSSTYSRKCGRCAMLDICNPRNVAVRKYMNSLWTIGKNYDNYR